MGPLNSVLLIFLCRQIWPVEPFFQLDLESLDENGTVLLRPFVSGYHPLGKNKITVRPPVQRCVLHV